MSCFECGLPMIYYPSEFDDEPNIWCCPECVIEVSS